MFKGLQEIYVVTQGRGVMRRSQQLPHTHRLPGVLPFTLNLLLIFEPTDAFPGPSLDPVLAQPRPEACPRTQGRAERTEKGKRRGEFEAGSERDGTNQKQMLVHV